MHHHFNIDHAAKYGLHEAIIISNIEFWIAKNKANNKHFHDGRYWTYNSVKAFAELFPYLSANQVRRALDSLVESGVLVKGNYNQSAYDRTSWFAFSDTWDCAECQIDLANLPNGNAAYAKPIPYIKPDTKPTPSLSPDESDDQKAAAKSPKAEKLPACPHLEILAEFAEILPELPQPKPELWDGARAKALSARWKWCLSATNSSTGKRYAETKDEALAWFARFFRYVGSCPHLMGQNQRGWTADLAWLCKADNFAKVLQGNYDERGQE